jgi:hypothetical protein
MPDSVPQSAELIEAVRRFLGDRVLPSLPADQRYQMLIAINVLAIVARQIELGARFDEAEALRLRALLERDGSREMLNAELARRIEAGEIGDGPELRAHLLRGLADALRINNPKWLLPADRTEEEG